MSRSRVTDDQLREAAANAATLRELLSEVGLVPCGGNYEIVRRRLERLGLLQERFLPRRSRSRSPTVVVAAVPLGLLVETVAVSVSYAEVLRAVDLPPDPGLARALRQRLERAQVPTDHFRSRGWARGRRRPTYSLAEVLVQGRRTGSGALRRRLLAEGLREAVCEGCDLRAWRGRPVALELDHVNGDRDDNRLENLRLLCPNCHAQTDTWRGRNVRQRPGTA